MVNFTLSPSEWFKGTAFNWSIVGIWNMTIQNRKTIKVRTFWRSDFIWSRPFENCKKWQISSRPFYIKIKILFIFYIKKTVKAKWTIQNPDHLKTGQRLTKIFSTLSLNLWKIFPLFSLNLVLEEKYIKNFELVLLSWWAKLSSACRVCERRYQPGKHCR